MIDWFRSLWQRWFGKEEEIPFHRPEPSQPPKWNGGFIPFQDEVTRKTNPPRHRTEPTRFEEEETEIADTISLGAGLSASIDQISPKDDDEKWEGGGGGFSGGGASGDWDSSNDPSSSNASSGGDDS